MLKLEISYSEGKFWMLENDERGAYETEITSWAFVNKAAKGFRFGMKYKNKNQRKYKISSIVTLTIEAMLSAIIFKLNEGQSVIVNTPDIEIVFFKG